mgnify:CR=1 FL=1
MYHNFKMVATTMFGLEEVLATELTNLGAQDVKVGVRSVSFVGDKGFMYKANIALRTAIRILKPIKRFRVSDEDDLYKKIQQCFHRLSLHVKIIINRQFLCFDYKKN